MIELQKYSKLGDDNLLKRVTAKHTDSRLKVIGYVSLAIVVSIVGITWSIGRSIYLGSDERAIHQFEQDSNLPSMKAYVNFIAETGRTYKDKTETARRYRVFKGNYDRAAKHMEHQRHLPYQVTMSNQFADLTPEEFMEKVAKNGGIVPQSVYERSGNNAFSPREEYVPIVDYVPGEIPESMNWVELNKVGAVQNQNALESSSSWAFSTIATLESLAAITNGS